MIHRPLAGLLASTAAGLLLLASGCQPESGTASTPSPNGVDYGPNKMPPPERLAPKPGGAPKSPGAPPLRR